jgi:acetyl-CoA carboxylase carboxyltransferase component
MDKISLLHTRKQKILDAGKNIRSDIDALIDENSFVELSAFSFSKNDFYGEDAEGEGVVTGFATIGDYPFCIVAQNSEVLCGGVSKANCEKIAKCLDQAEKTSTPVVYLLSSNGVQIGEGVNVLEGLAGLILKSSQLKGTVPQYLIIDGDVYGQIAILGGICDYTFFIDKKSVLALNSPLVISASSGVNKPKTEIGGSKGLNKANISTFEVSSLDEVKDKIIKLSDIISVDIEEYDNLNELLPALDKKVDEKSIMTVFDKGSVIELGNSYSPEIKCVLGRIGGIAVASAIFVGDEGVKLNALNMRKLKDFAELVCCYNLPYVTFVNTLGAETTIEVNNSLLIKEIGEYVSILDCMSTAKISVVYGKAIGLGYTIFSAKSMGYDYTYAFATAKIALFDSVQGAEIEFADVKGDKQKLAEKYADENSDPINTAKGGYIDNIIQPSNVKQYLIASLQMLLK